MATKFKSRKEYERWKTRRVTTAVTQARKRRQRAILRRSLVMGLLLAVLVGLGIGVASVLKNSPSEDAEAPTGDAELAEDGEEFELEEDTRDADDSDDVDIGSSPFAPPAGDYQGVLQDMKLTVGISPTRIESFTWTRGDIESFTWEFPDTVRYTVAGFDLIRDGVTSTLRGERKGFRIRMEDQKPAPYFKLEGEEGTRGKLDLFKQQVQGRVFVVVPDFDELLGGRLDLPDYYKDKKQFSIPMGSLNFSFAKDKGKHRVRTKAFVRELRFYSNEKGVFGSVDGVKFKLE